jgi:hypothetical protein
VARKNRITTFDYSMLSSYLGRSATVIVFSAIIAISAAALFLEQEDMAHMPFSIGVFAFDSLGASCTLDLLADFVREKAGGDIEWRYFGPGAKPCGCDLYLATALQVFPYITSGELQCPLISTTAGGGRYSRGAVIVRSDNEDARFDKVIFSSPISAAGFLSPFIALRETGRYRCSGEGDVEFAHEHYDEKRVIFGVLYGAYDAGGIGHERFKYLEKQGVVRSGELKVLLTGEAFPEILLASDASADSKKIKNFTNRFLVILDMLPSSLRLELAELGIGGFSSARAEDIDIIKRFSPIIPQELSRFFPDHGAVKKPPHTEASQ